MNPSPICPACGERERLVVLSETPVDVVWDALEGVLRRVLPPALRARNTPEATLTLRRCDACDLRFFWPLRAGDAEFYASVVDDVGYRTEKWEFAWVRARTAAGSRALDVGCGHGVFLAGLLRRGDTVFGLEQSDEVAARTAARGIPMSMESIETYARANAGAYDFASAFHVLEHVTDPPAFVRDVARCVRPGGSVFLSMPNDERTFRPTLEPLDFPPHHLTRWTERALRSLAGRLGLRVVEVGFEPLAHDTARYTLEKRLHAAVRASVPAVGNALGAAAGFLAARAIFPSRRLYEAAELARRFELRGLSLVARLEVPR
ncbi:MAG: class I SAM-dependent methyltransferase [Deltaproteobacteria bacterium]|nr:class I SAM-dependent methyltransferase [Myxococcales bacterium]MDP3218364.1 class I SAM-dependent methyltransferase [Deltaproteobacteria bacterium]